MKILKSGISKLKIKPVQEINLSIYSYFEWCLGSSADHHREFHKTFLETEFDSKLNAMTATKRLWEIPLGDRGHWNIEYPYLGFISSNKKIIDYDGDKETFIGQYGSLEKPAGNYFRKSFSKKSGKWNDSIGTVKTKLKSIQIILQNISVFLLAYLKKIKGCKVYMLHHLKKFQHQENIDKAFN